MAAPLTKAHLTQINKALKDLDRADEILQRAKGAGLPVEDQEARSREQRDKLLGIKNNFFAGE